ncbi:hypothetical protein [Catellatospora citrea]|uniref:Uncharacterized protein n=1 Tax=Catellatospora citrea TaxID=53366 RepID=A0A8J3KQP8_9ACTN|nr:hypothetical protein [Catellatospora citrea]GIG03149.1 hypothetical protein Cci01nite_82420 [Catellatospora citrea]
MVIAYETGDVLVLCSPADPREPLDTLAARLPADPGRSVVVMARSLAARPDLGDVLGTALAEQLGGSADGIRLVALGLRDDPAHLEPEIRRLAEHLGVELTAPLGPVTVATDGTIAVAETDTGASTTERPGGWLTCGPGVAAHYSSPWLPTPSWAAGPTRLPTHSLRHGAAALRHVPSGYWLLPHSVHVDEAGIGTLLPPDPDALTVLLGGSGAAPLPVDDVTALLAQLPGTGGERLLLLPGALPPGQVERLRRSRPHTRVRAAVPVRAVDGGPAVAEIDERGRPAWRPVGTTADRVTNRRPSPPRRAPWSPAVERPLPGRATAAGWWFPSARPPIGLYRAPTGFLVEVATDASGFLVAADKVTPAELAALIKTASRQAPAQVVLGTHGEPPSDDDLGSLADELGLRVLAADTDVSLAPTGLLTTPGVFRQWHPTTAGTRRVVVPLGATVPGLATPYRAWSPPVPPLSPMPRTAPAAPQPTFVDVAPEPLTADFAATVDTVRWSMAAARLDTIRAAPADRREPAAPTTPATVVAPEPAGPRSGEPAPVAPVLPSPAAPKLPGQSGQPRVSAQGPVWVTELPCEPSDRADLRKALNGRFDAYARVVVRTLAEEPGLRNAAPSAELTTGLIAARAYYAHERSAVNGVLRTGGDAAQTARTRVVAGCTLYGMRSLPSVLGPVYLAGALAPHLVAGYRPGDRLIEPAFLDAYLTVMSAPDDRHDGTVPVEFAVWSVSARRADLLNLNGGPAALFAAGTPFRVLAIDPPQGAAAAVRVLLQDLTAGRAGDGERILARLRNAHPEPVTGQPAPVAIDFAPGMDSLGRPFTPREGPE